MELLGRLSVWVCSWGEDIEQVVRCFEAEDALASTLQGGSVIWFCVFSKCAHRTVSLV